MSKEERHLQTKIRMFEDILLRTKNPSQVDNIQMELTRMRAKLQKNGVLTRALSFLCVSFCH